MGRVLYISLTILITHLMPAIAAQPKYTPNAAFRWTDIALEATAREVDRDGARPTVISRTLSIVMTAMYDAWAAYDGKAVGSRFGGRLRRPVSERTLENKSTAIAYAACRALLDVYPEDRAWIESAMNRMGFDPKNATTDISTPEGIGNVAAFALVNYRHHDGANQLGDEVGSDGKPYSDYTFYAPVNTPDKLIDPNKWQPIPFTNTKGEKFVLGFLTPHWYRVKPFALPRSNLFQPPPPPRITDKELKKQTGQVIEMNATLTNEDKAIVEFMRDGPRSTGQSGHWLRFAQDVSKRDRNDLDRDVKLFFTVANVAFDAFIAAWHAKRVYDTSRPWTLVRYYYRGRKIRGWLGPGQGVGELPAEEWHPYSPFSFVTPPFPGYVSGHSTVSGACARVLALFTGSDRFGITETRNAGILTEPDAACGNCEVKLEMPTFTEAAKMAGISRVLGGYHIRADNIEGLKLGKKVADNDWPKIEAYFTGSAKSANEDPGQIASPRE